MTAAGWVLQPAFLPWVALVLGLCIGSFLNVVIHRLPKMLERGWREECAELAGQPLPPEPPYSLVAPRSACPACGQRIRAWENVPIVSWLVLRGRCSACRARISAKYPLVEALAGIGAAYAAWRFGATATALGAAFASIHEAVIGAAAGYLSLWLVFHAYRLATGKEGMGYGDFKMNAAVGAFLGWKLLPLVILLSSLVGLAFGALQMFAARGRWDASFRFHFGPYLAIAGIVAMFWGEPILRWYLQRL
jgi:leader peptidase (prepilin peptidase)/N-methyltransferase